MRAVKAANSAVKAANSAVKAANTKKPSTGKSSGGTGNSRNNAAGSGTKAVKSKSKPAGPDVVLQTGLSLCDEQIGLLRELFSNCTRLVVGKLHGGFSGALVLSTQGYDVQGVDEPTVTKLDYEGLMRKEMQQANAVCQHLGASAPAVLRGPMFGANYGAVVLECAGACWVLPQFAPSLTGDGHGQALRLISTYKQLLCDHLMALASSSSDAGVAGSSSDAGAARASVATTVQGEDALMAVLDELWSPGGPLRQLALTSAAAREVRGKGGIAAECLFHIADAAVHVLLPGAEDERWAVCKAKMPPALFAMLERLVSDPKLCVNGKQLTWAKGKQAARFSNSLLADASVDAAALLAEGAEPLAVCFEALHQLSVGQAGPTALPIGWAPAQTHAHGDLNGCNILVDLKGMAWLIDFSYAGPAMGSAFDDQAKLLTCLLLEYLPLGDSNESLGQAMRVVDALFPTSGELGKGGSANEAAEARRGDDVALAPWAELALRIGQRLIGLAAEVAEAASAELLKKREAAAKAAAEVSATTAIAAGDDHDAPAKHQGSHPCLFLLPVLRHALLALRFRDTSLPQKRLAWYLVVRSATALKSALQLALQPVRASDHTNGSSYRETLRLAPGQTLVLRCSLSELQPDWRLVQVRPDPSSAASGGAPLMFKTLWSLRMLANDSSATSSMITRPNVEYDALGRLHHMGLQIGPQQLPQATEEQLAKACAVLPFLAQIRTTQEFIGRSEHLGWFRRDPKSGSLLMPDQAPVQASGKTAEAVELVTPQRLTAQIEVAQKLKLLEAEARRILSTGDENADEQLLGIMTDNTLSLTAATSRIEQWALEQLKHASRPGTLQYASGQPLIVYLQGAKTWVEARVAASSDAAGSATSQLTQISGGVSGCRLTKDGASQKLEFQLRVNGNEVWRQCGAFYAFKMTLAQQGIASGELHTAQEMMISITGATSEGAMREATQAVGQEIQGWLTGLVNTREAMQRPDVLSFLGIPTQHGAPITATATAEEPVPDLVEEPSAPDGSGQRLRLPGGRIITVALRLHNHAPRSMPLRACTRALQRYFHGLRVQHATLVDPLSGARLDVKEHCVPLRFLAAPSSATDGAERDVKDGGIVMLSDVTDLYAHLRRHYVDLVEGRCQAPDAAILLTAPPAAGKTSFISQLVMHALPPDDEDGSSSRPIAAAAASSTSVDAHAAGVAAHRLCLVPICIKVMDLQQKLRMREYAPTFAHAWNWVDAYLRVTLGGESERYRALRQVLMSRQALLLLDGLDEGGEFKAEIEAHITETLAPQQHLLVVTSRPNAVDERKWAGFQRLQLGGLTRLQQAQVIQQRLATRGLSSLSADLERYVAERMQLRVAQHEHSGYIGSLKERQKEMAEALVVAALRAATKCTGLSLTVGTLSTLIRQAFQPPSLIELSTRRRIEPEKMAAMLLLGRAALQTHVQEELSAIANAPLSELRSLDAAQRDKMLACLVPSLVEELTEWLPLDESRVESLTSNPLLLSMTISIFESVATQHATAASKGTGAAPGASSVGQAAEGGTSDAEGRDASRWMPQRLSELYQTAMSILLERIDRKARGEQGPSTPSLLPFLQAIALDAHLRSSRQIDESDILRVVSGTKLLESGWQAARELLHAGRLHVLATLQRSPLKVQFSHLSLQEFLCATAIAEGRRDPHGAPDIFGNPQWWRNVERFGEELRQEAFPNLILQGREVDGFLGRLRTNDNAYFKTPLITMATAGNERWVHRLLEIRVDPDARDANGSSALSWACQEGYTSIVEMLLAHKANVDAIGCFNMSGLMFATRRGHEDVVNLLLQNKADVNFYDSLETGQGTALDIAQRNAPSGGDAKLFEPLTRITDALVATGAKTEEAIRGPRKEEADDDQEREQLDEAVASSLADQKPSLEEKLEIAAKRIQEADALLIWTGDGFGWRSVSAAALAVQPDPSPPLALTISGAGCASANGTYLLERGDDRPRKGGRPIYTHSDRPNWKVQFSSYVDCWIIDDVDGAAPYKAACRMDSTAPIDCQWVIYERNGEHPCPTVRAAADVAAASSEGDEESQDAQSATAVQVGDAVHSVKGHLDRLWPPQLTTNLSEADINNAHWFESDPRLAWAYWRWQHRFATTCIAPHSGFATALRWGARMKAGHFVVSNQVDGLWAQSLAKEAKQRLFEPLGRLTRLQSVQGDDATWEAPAGSLEKLEFAEFDLEAGEAVEVLLKPDGCHGVSVRRCKVGAIAEAERAPSNEVRFEVRQYIDDGGPLAWDPIISDEVNGLLRAMLAGSGSVEYDGWRNLPDGNQACERYEARLELQPGGPPLLYQKTVASSASDAFAIGCERHLRVREPDAAGGTTAWHMLTTTSAARHKASVFADVNDDQNVDLNPLRKGDRGVLAIRRKAAGSPDLLRVAPSSPLPTTPEGLPARPNVRMYDDQKFNTTVANEQGQRFEQWRRGLGTKANLVMLVAGCSSYSRNFQRNEALNRLGAFCAEAKSIASNMPNATLVIMSDDVKDLEGIPDCLPEERVVLLHVASCEEGIAQIDALLQEPAGAAANNKGSKGSNQQPMLKSANNKSATK